MITKGVKKLKKPRNVSVCLPPGFDKCYLSVVHQDGRCQVFPISKQVAEALIANGMGYQG